MDDPQHDVRPTAPDGPAFGAEPDQAQLRLIEQLAALAARIAEPAWRERLPSFVRAYYELASAEMLALRSPENLVAVAQRHLRAAMQRPHAGLVVRASAPVRPLEGGSSAFGSLDTCLEDMPYIVETVAIAVRDAGGAIDWAVHPVLRVRRDEDGRITAVDGPAAQNGVLEAWMHVEFEPLRREEDYPALERALGEAFGDLRRIVADRDAMQARALELARSFSPPPCAARDEELAESAAFLSWLTDHRFVFFGYSESCTEADAGGRQHFVEQPQRALGLCRPGERYSDIDALIAPREELNKYAESTRIVVITKANQRARIHLDEYMDVISVKRLAADGRVLGTSRFLGLFSTDVYIDRPLTIPLVRRKVARVLERARFPPESFTGRYLREIMYLLPREELFQSNDQELYDTVMGIRVLRERHQLKLFMRRDRYGRFYSCMVYLPRERYTRELRDRLGQELSRLFQPLSVDRHVDFFRGGMARIRYVLRTPPGTQISLSVAQIEQRLRAAARTWREQLREVLAGLPDATATPLLLRFGDAFSLQYQLAATPEEAAQDLQYLARLSPTETLLPRVLVDDAQLPARVTGLKFYAWERPVALSDVLPTLENFGLRVLNQTPTRVEPRQGPPLWIDEFHVEAPACELPAARQRAYFETALLKAWRGEIENDRLNRLLLAAGLDWRQVVCLRMLAKYVNQIGLPYGRTDIEDVLAAHAHFARLLMRYFESRFDPALSREQSRSRQLRDAQALDAALDAVSSLHEDRVLRALLSVARAGLRSNFYQHAADGTPKPYVSLKLDPSKIPELPRPLPMFEIWVYAPQVEGVHLRGGRVARGGLRWSDRREDFRTEILGLMKAQRVKNAVIVPVGAKGGFVVKQPVEASNRDAWMRQGIDCYSTFLRGLLDITDNRVRGEIVAPENAVRYDADDPYLVVAADKGTAGFSDIANTVAAEYGFWLGDAFASGGSHGYDHKKMGITARGAWESVKRHFRELTWTDAGGNPQHGFDIQRQPFTVVGIGDMSGDVFGNGMLLSRQIKLVAAFDHRHIFLDPDPDPARSFAERERLFALPRSSWADYDAALISRGGGVFPRSAKSVRLSDEARSALGIAARTLTPPELIRAILCAPVDLLWNGGIGTYVKASHEGHDRAGDRANDMVRVDGKALRAKVVGEGGNLGFTQAGRIEYALNGGRINTDAIDNSAGVHTSDREVNIKIPLNALLADGALDAAERDLLLQRCADDVASAVLRENEVQPACISLEQQVAPQRLDDHSRLMRLLERDGLLDRALEVLPDEDALRERRNAGAGLTRPELAVLVAYAKISLFEAALASALPDDPVFAADLLDYFPRLLVERFGPAYAGHRLRREIVATLLSNAVVDRMGVAFAHLCAEDLGVPRSEVIKACAAAYRIYDAPRYWHAIEALDLQLPAELQYELMRRAVGLLRHATRALAQDPSGQDRGVGELVERYREARVALEAALPALLPPSYREDWERAVADLQRRGVPAPPAALLGNARVLGMALPVADLARVHGVDIRLAASVYFLGGERFRMPWIHSAVLALEFRGPWQSIARNNLRDDAYRVHYALADQILRAGDGAAEARLDAWCHRQPERLRFALGRLQELAASGTSDYMTLAVAVRELQRLCAPAPETPSPPLSG